MGMKKSPERKGGKQKPVEPEEGRSPGKVFEGHRSKGEKGYKEHVGYSRELVEQRK